MNTAMPSTRQRNRLRADSQILKPLTAKIRAATFHNAGPKAAGDTSSKLGSTPLPTNHNAGLMTGGTDSISTGSAPLGSIGHTNRTPSHVPAHRLRHRIGMVSKSTHR